MAAMLKQNNFLVRDLLTFQESPSCV